MFAVDIETIPNTNLIDLLPEPEVKLGNTKDPVKIQEKIEQAKQKQIDDMALNPFFSRICSIAIHGDDISEYIVMDDISDAGELELLNWFFPKIAVTSTYSPTIISWNGIVFDIPFLYKRAMLLKYALPTGSLPLSHWIKRYTHIPHCDLKQEFAGWDKNKHISLETASNIVLGKSKKEHDVTKFIDLIDSGKGDEIGIYNINDAILTYEIYKESEGYLF